MSARPPADAVKADEDWESDDIDDLDLEDGGTAQISVTQEKKRPFAQSRKNKLEFKNAGEDLYFSVEAAGTAKEGSKVKKKRNSEK